jgi:hypothetical protein
MFGSNALPLPSPFAREHHPLRLSAEIARPLPSGECKYMLLHPAPQNTRCPCQSFHHNRAAPGTICECGHQACFHVHEKNETLSSSDAVSAIAEKLNFVIDKVKRLEDVIHQERSNREASLLRDRHNWERDIRILREALAPFYQSEKDMKRRIVEVEDRVEGNYDEHVRLRDRVVAVDDATMGIERRVEELEGSRNKRRRVGRPNVHEVLQNGYVSSDQDNFRRISSSNDGGSVHTPSSRALSPNGPPPNASREEARSSGILNLVAELPRPTPFTLPPRLSPPHEEVRSSGFLTVDLTDRLKEKATSDPPRPIVPKTAARITPPQDRASPATSTKSIPDVPTRVTWSPLEINHSKMPIIDVITLPGNMSPRKRKHELDHLALDVLADVTVASPLVR